MSHALLLALLLAVVACAADAGSGPAPPGEELPAADGPAEPPASRTAGVDEPHGGEQSEAQSEPAPSARAPTSNPQVAESREASSQAACAGPPCYGTPVRIGQFDPEVLSEVSGLAVSSRDPDILYVLDDGSGTPTVWVVRRDGEMLGSFEVQGLDARDTESLAVGPCGDRHRSCLYIGDVGDNRRSRQEIAVLRVEEPDLAGGLPLEPLPGEAVRLRYPDGAHDAEALLVGADGALVIITKAPFDPETQVTGATHVYRAVGFADGSLEHLGELTLPEPPLSFHAQLAGNVVTGAEAVAGHVVLRTYDQVLSLRGDDLATLPTWDVRAIPSPFELQSEAIALDVDGCGVLTAGERVGDIWLVECTA